MTERATTLASSDLSSVLSQLRALGRILGVDAHLGEFCARGETVASPLIVGVSAALVSAALREGHPCLPLEEFGGAVVADETGSLSVTLPALSLFLDELRKSTSVTSIDTVLTSNGTAATSNGTTATSTVAESLSTPLVLDEEGRLYLARYFDHEQRLAAHLADLHAAAVVLPEEAYLEERLAHYFPTHGHEPGAQLQKEAARVALRRRFSVISGGPGTGKTSTVVKILALLFEVAHRENRPTPEIMLLSPTGKAAARMMESIAEAQKTLEMSEVAREQFAQRGALSQAVTVHRALGVVPQNSNRFRHGPGHPLPADVVLVDEASMIDLSLMRHLVDALGPKAKLILLGDRHQLASVQAGSVLSELCLLFAGEEERSLVELTKSFRFKEDSGIAEVARAVRDGQPEEALSVLSRGSSDLSYLPGDAEAALKDEVVHWYGDALRQKTPEEVLSSFNKFRILCAHRRGKFGVQILNEKVRTWLSEEGLLPFEGEIYQGRLILIMENDYGSGLSNGDVGLFWPAEGGRLTCHFAGQGGAPRQLAPAQLPAFESAFALTIHKSQGSEHDRVAVVLPQAGSPLLTRELLYTAVTRARRSVSVYGTDEAVTEAVKRSVVRHSGLKRALARALGRETS